MQGKLKKCLICGVPEKWHSDFLLLQHHRMWETKERHELYLKQLQELKELAERSRG